jgi:putative inorganic carbon (HCO3(-)) transporter
MQARSIAARFREMVSPTHRSQSFGWNPGGAAQLEPVQGRHLLLIVAAMALSLVAGYLVVRYPDLFQLAGFVSLRHPLVLAAGLAVTLVILRYSDLGLVLLVVLVYLNLSEILVRSHGLPSFLQLLVLPLSLAAWTAAQRAPRSRRSPTALSVVLVLYAFVVLFSSTLARETEIADARFLEGLKSLVIYGLVVALAASAAAIRQSAWGVVAAGTLLAGLGVLQVLTGDFSHQYGGLARVKNAHIFGEVFEPRIAGPLGDPNFFAQILVMVVPLALFLAWEERRLRFRVSAYVCTAVLVGGTVLTYSRGGALALASVLLLALVSRGVQARQLVVAATVLILVLISLPADFTRRLVTISQLLPGQEQVLHPDSALEERRLFTAVAWKMFGDHSVLGVGAGNYTAYFDEYADRVGSVNREYGDPHQQRYPHSLYLEIGAETGLVGLAVFLCAVVVCFTYLRRARVGFLAAGEDFSAGLARAFQIALVGYLVSSLFLHGHFQRYLWLVFAFSAALFRLSGSTESSPAAGASEEDS